MFPLYSLQFFIASIISCGGLISHCLALGVLLLGYIIFGAEFTKAYALRHGTRIYPNQYAVWVKLMEVEEENTSLQQIEQKDKEHQVTEKHIL